MDYNPAKEIYSLLPLFSQGFLQHNGQATIQIFPASGEYPDIAQGEYLDIDPEQVSIWILTQSRPISGYWPAPWSVANTQLTMWVGPPIEWTKPGSYTVGIHT